MMFQETMFKKSTQNETDLRDIYFTWLNPDEGFA
jgi:hypothetical protein